MALLYQATLNPSKVELLEAWIPHQSWLGDVDATSVEIVGAYRFDDPDGAVGIETHLLRTADGRILQVPVTYRGSPVPGFESFLIAPTMHSVLGERWVYDACGDPVYVKALATAILTGGRQAELDVVTDRPPDRSGGQRRRWCGGVGPPTLRSHRLLSVSSSNEGAATVISTSHLDQPSRADPCTRHRL